MQPAVRAGCGKPYFVVVDELLDAPPGLEPAELAPPVPLLLEAPPLGLEDIPPDALPEAEPPMPELLDVPPVPLVELAPPGLLGDVVEVDDELLGDEESFVVVLLLLDEPPGTTVVPPPPGTTVVVSLRSHALSARAATKTIKYPLRFMSTPFSFVCGYENAPAC